MPLHTFALLHTAAKLSSLKLSVNPDIGSPGVIDWEEELELLELLELEREEELLELELELELDLLDDDDELELEELDDEVKFA